MIGSRKLGSDFSREDLIEIVERASTITERLGARFVLDSAQKKDPIVDSRIKQWCQVAGKGNWEKFEQRLAWDGLDLSTVHRALGSIRISDEQQLPAWAETLNECLKATAAATLETLEQATPGKHRFLDPERQLPFEEVLLPFINVARQNLIAFAGSHYDLLSEKAHASLERGLLRWLSFLCSPSMELEFSAFRASRQSTLARLKGKLSSADSRQQYRDFIQVMLSGGVGTFFREYPVLARLVATATDLWVDANNEFLWRLASDWCKIKRTFQDETELGQVVAVRSNLSDRHHNGRSVTAVTFASDLKLIYKPKDLDIEQAYFKLLAWLNEHGVPLPFKLLKMLDRSTYRWVEFVESRPCQDKEEAIAYYQRFGVLLCLVYVLQATDLHFRNIIACGEHPVLIDLETLMHPWMQEVEDLEASKKDQYLANQQVEHSVLRTGLLPQWQFSLENRSFDVSGLGGGGQQETSFRVPKWRNINTDNMVLSYEYGKTQPSANKPSLDGVDLAPNDYLEEIVDGFRQMYRFLMEHRRAILALDCPMTALAHQSVRFIFRPTIIYRLISTTSLDPKFLRDGAERSIQLDLLSRVMLLSDTKPLFWPLLSVEQQALEQMDMPLFTARSDSDGLTIAPNQTIDKCFTEPSFNLVVSRLKQLNDEDLEQQISFIQDSIYSRIAGDAY